MVSLAWGAILKLAGISALFSALGVWIVVRFTRPLDSYTEELAKQVARHQNLDRIVEEQKRLAETTETIKAELSHESWDRQTRFTAKRDLYVRLAEALGRLRDLHVMVKGYEKQKLQGASNRPDGALFEQTRLNTLHALEGAVEKLHHAQDAAPMMIPDEPYKVLLDFHPRQIRFGTVDWEQDCDYNIEMTRWVLYHFQVAARADLGYEPMVWKPTILTPNSPTASQI